MNSERLRQLIQETFGRTRVRAGNLTETIQSLASASQEPEVVNSWAATLNIYREFLKIPNGTPPEDRLRSYLSQQNEPDSQTLREFFGNPDVWRRVVYTPSINVDETDDWGMFGYEPGFVFICGLIRGSSKNFKTFSEVAAAAGATFVRACGEHGTPVWYLPHFDLFPKFAFDYQIVSKSRTPRTYNYLKGELGEKLILERPPIQISESPIMIIE